MEGKLCGRCNEIKPYADFAKRKKSDDGLQAICKACKAEIYYNKLMATPKKCSDCGNIYPRTEEFFNKHNKTADGLTMYCIDCAEKRLDVKREKMKESRAEGVTSTIRSMEFKEGVIYRIGGRSPRYVDFQGRLVSQTNRFIVLKHDVHGYNETFMKVDFATGERNYKEVVNA